MKTVVEQLVEPNAVPSGDNLFRLDDRGGAIPRGLSSIRYATEMWCALQVAEGSVVNWTRITLGGVVAGTVMLFSQIVLHTVVLVDQGTSMVQDWASRGLDASAALEPSVPLTVALYGLGFICVWVYAAVRPRFGPGAATAICVGVVAWATSHLFTAIYVHAGVVIVPPRMVWLPAVWTFVEVPLATVAGCLLYRE